MVSKLRMMLNFAKAMAIQIAAGLPVASEEEIQKRADICSNCPSMEDGRCKECGCFLELKIPLGTSECPTKKW